MTARRMYDHPYRVVVTHGGAKSAVITLLRVGIPDAMPTRVRAPTVDDIYAQVRVHLPPHTPTGVCMPPRPERDNIMTNYDRELYKMYELYDQLANAPEIVK